jgi:Uma2 family endonuclease
MRQRAAATRADDGRMRFMGTSRHAVVEQLYRVPEEGKAEIIDGRIVEMSPAGGLHGYVAGAIFASLLDYSRGTRRGIALPDSVGFLVDLPHRWSFCPDAAFWTGAPLTRKFPEGAPALAVEVRSPEDYGAAAERRLADKRADYFAAGTTVVWDVDVASAPVVFVYRSADPLTPTAYRSGELAEAEPAVPGWTMPVDDLMPR